MVDDIRVTDRKNALASKWKERSTFPVLEREKKRKLKLAVDANLFPNLQVGKFLLAGAPQSSNLILSFLRYYT